MRTILVKSNCTRGVVYPRGLSVHDAYMGKKPTRKPPPGSRLRPQYQRTCIKQWRVYKKLSQDQLADKVGAYLLERGITEKGYTYASIGRIENGVIPYSQPIMEGISYALGVPVEMLIALPPPDHGQPMPPDPGTLVRLWQEGAKAAIGNSPPPANPGMKAKRLRRPG